MFGVDPDALTELLTVRRTNVRGQEIVIKLQKDDATFRRDAVSKALYARLFEWIVEMANDHLGYKKGETLPFIGVLDIFGFETFKVNGLEQVLINFANEYLQNVFNKQVFEAELKLFADENISCALDDCPDNQPCVELLSGKGGVLDVLNGQCAAIQPSEDKFVRDLAKDHKANAFFPEVHRKDARDNFKILHFAGAVQYTVGGWLLKNSDPLPESMPQVFSEGKVKLIQKLFKVADKAEEGEVAGGAADAGPKRGGAKKVTSPTVSMSFVKSMKSLTEELSTTKCNFIRCIKPNAQMRAGVYNRKYALPCAASAPRQQLHTSGAHLPSVLPLTLPCLLPFCFFLSRCPLRPLRFCPLGTLWTSCGVSASWPHARCSRRACPRVSPTRSCGRRWRASRRRRAAFSRGSPRR